MPKVTDTRRLRAADLLKTATEGPCISAPGGVGLDRHQTEAVQTAYREQYDLWAKTWIIPRLRQLVPELKQKREN